MDEIELLRTHVTKLKKIVEGKDLTIKKLREEVAQLKQKKHSKSEWVEI